jgi:hypothetical protein
MGMTDDKKPRELREWTIVFTQYKDTSIGVAYDKAHRPQLYSNDNGIYEVIDKTELLCLQQELTSLRESLKLAVETLEACTQKTPGATLEGELLGIVAICSTTLAKIKAKGEL